MNEDTTNVETTEETPKAKSPLARRIMIVTGAVAGIIAAGAIAYVAAKSTKSEEDCGCEVPSEELPTEE